MSNLQAQLSILEENPQHAAKCLAAYTVEVRTNFHVKYPRTNYPDESAWAAAMSEALKKKIRADLEQLESAFPADGLHPTAVAEFANVLRDDQFEKELDLLERVDRDIDRTLKRLYQLKGMKQVLVSPLLNTPVPKLKTLPMDGSVPAQH
jgi:hypothetical protein